MRTSIAAIAFVCLCLSSAAFGQSAILKGKVVDDKENPVASVRIITPDGQADVTDSKGQFTIAFSTKVQPGIATRIELRDKPNWVIYEPLLGNCVIQNKGRNFEPLKVILVPKGSLLALSPKRLSQVIARWADERVRLRSQVKEQQSQLDEYAFLREYAEQYGFTLEQFREAADEWANGKIAADKLEAGWQEYWKKNYDRAAQLGYESRIAFKEKLKRDKEKRLEDGRQFIRSAKLEGDARYAEDKFREAVAAYQTIEAAFQESELLQEDFPAEWAETKSSVGNAKVQLGLRVEGQESQLLLAEAATAYREALKVFTRGQLPQGWAGMQSNLGIALSLQGERSSGDESVRVLAEAVTGYREALKVFTREQSPQYWAMTQNNLGNALKIQGQQSGGEENMPLLAEAVTAYRKALTIYTREQLPQDWAGTQNNLGDVLRSQGERVSGTESLRLLAEAVTACREALKVRTREQSPQDWAMTQNNMGIALSLQGERSSGNESVRRLAEAVTAYREVLKVFTRKQSPQYWAMTQNNLGNSLRSQGERSSGAESARLLAEAITTYREALKVFTRELLPQYWAATQNNLAKAYYYLKEWNNAAIGYANVLTLFPEYEEGYQRLSTIYHGRVFEYAKAYALHDQWLRHLPEDVSAQAAFAETHFTTGRFAEFATRLKPLLAHPNFSNHDKIALQMIEVANLLALDQAKEVPARLDALIAAVGAQPTDFKITWSFNGTLHFIGQSEKLAARRDWLKLLFNAAECTNRDAVLKALREAQAGFKP